MQTLAQLQPKIVKNGPFWRLYLTTFGNNRLLGKFTADSDDAIEESWEELTKLVDIQEASQPGGSYLLQLFNSPNASGRNVSDFDFVATQQPAPPSAPTPGLQPMGGVPMGYISQDEFDKRLNERLALERERFQIMIERERLKAEKEHFEEEKKDWQEDYKEEREKFESGSAKLSHALGLLTSRFAEGYLNGGMVGGLAGISSGEEGADLGAPPPAQEPFVQQTPTQQQWQQWSSQVGQSEHLINEVLNAVNFYDAYKKQQAQPPISPDGTTQIPHDPNVSAEGLGE